MTTFPFTMRPTGWFQIGWSADVPAGGIKPFEYLGQQLVGFRTSEGELAVLDAHCPHLGAHLGYGTCLVDDNVQCRYHGWEWSKDGENVRIPYEDRPNRSKQLRKWPVVERNECIFLWHDPYGGEPRWEITDVFQLPEDISEGVLADNLRAAHHHTYPHGNNFKSRVPMHPQQSLENSVDTMHFRYTHGAASNPTLLEFYAVGPLWRSVVGFTSPKTGDIALKASILVNGVGLSYTRFAHPRQEYRLILGVTPVDNEHCDIFVSHYLRARDEDTAGELPAHLRPEMDEIKRPLEEDLIIWLHQQYIDKPVLARSDARPYGELRRWCRQFYELPVEAAPVSIS